MRIKTILLSQVCLRIEKITADFQGHYENKCMQAFISLSECFVIE